MVRRATSSSVRGCSLRVSMAGSAHSRRISRRWRRRFASRAWGRTVSSTNSVSRNLKKIANAMTAGGGGASQIPAGFTYLGQFTDHDLTFDKTKVMLGEHVSPAQLLQARSPSLDLDSLYGAGPADPVSAKFYEADGLHLKMGKTLAAEGIAAKGGLRPSARRGNNGGEEAQGDHSGSEERREPRGRSDPSGHDPFPQPRRRHAPRLGAAPRSASQSSGDRHEALPVGASNRLPTRESAHRAS